ncbi:MAG: prepilin-type N-terminal cleavage/methylation domain-containing protein [Verrucomicrobiae bacterium]|nr:prepilin-type N-terminal cleavage/methylation domain-containing protein [Verrucomicrobiae bacterium]
METLKSNRIPPSRGMTLIELLVAMVISSVLLVILASLLSVSLTQWNRQSGKRLEQTEAQMALATMVEDLQSILLKRDGSEWLQVKAVVVDDLGQTPQLMFLARPTDVSPDRKGDVCAISYRLQKRDPFHAKEPIHALYRAVIPPEAAIQKLGAEDLDIAYWSGGSIDPVATDNLIAANIVRLSLSFQLEEPDGTIKTVSEGFGWHARREITVGAAEDSPYPEGTFIRRLEIRLTSIDRTAQLLLSDGTLPLDEIISRFGRDYGTVVEFPRPLF